MSLEGRVEIEVKRGAAPAVHVSFRQPGQIDRLLRGKTPGEAAPIVPALFSLCAMAQAQAAQCALDAAALTACDEAVLTARQCLTEIESLRENTLRIALDWPRFLGERADPAQLKPLMRLVPDLKAALFVDGKAFGENARTGPDQAAALAIIASAEHSLIDLVFGEPIDAWRARPNAQSVRAWAQQCDTVAARLLARVSAEGWDVAGRAPSENLGTIGDDAVRTWIAGTDDQATGLPRTSLSGLTPETTLLSRHAHDPRLSCNSRADTSRDGPCPVPPGLWDRLTARLIELAELPGRMRLLLAGELAPSRGTRLGTGIGVGRITAARGQLMHAVTLDGGRVRTYRILPPTRWNFDANGVAARTLGQIACSHAGDVALLAELTINAIDPCVGHTVRIN